MRSTRGGGTCLNAPQAEQNYVRRYSDLIKIISAWQKNERSERLTIISENDAFRFYCERCRLTRGAEDEIKKSAFTLAEVLITLGIIGVVAALTLPSLIANKQNKELQTALMKNYSVMQQALLDMQKDMGETPRPELFGMQEFKDEYIKHFNILLDCGLGSTDITDRVNAKTYCPSEQSLESDGGRRYTEHYKTFNRSKYLDPSLLNNGQFVINDGALIMIENWSRGILYISVDVNGVPKKPNVWGRDLFTFQLMSDGKLLPMGSEGTSYYKNDTAYCSMTSSSTYNGVGCTYRALTDKTFWNNI